MSEKTMSFVKLQAAERGAVVIAGSFAPEVYSIDGDGAARHAAPASLTLCDGYDAYGAGYVAYWIDQGQLEVTLNRKPKRIISAVGTIMSKSTTSTEAAVVKVEMPCPIDDATHITMNDAAADADLTVNRHRTTDAGRTIRFKTFDFSGNLVDLDYDERLAFVIVADFSSA